MNTFLKTHLKLASFSHRIFMKFHDFFGIDFRIDFFIDFSWKRLPKRLQKVHGGGRPFCSLFATLSFMLIYVDFMLNLAHFGLPFGSRWLTFGSRWLPFGSLLAPFGSLLAHFWCPLAHFWCPFLLFSSPRDQFSHFCCILSSFFISFWIFHENIVQNLSCQRQCSAPGLEGWVTREDLLSVGVRSMRFGKIRFDGPRMWFSIYMKISCQIWFLHNFSFAFFRRLRLLDWSVWQRHANQKRQRERVNSNNRPNKFRKSNLGPSNRIFPKRIERTPTESTSSLVTHPYENCIFGV